MMFELERLKLDQESLEDLIKRSEFDFAMVKRDHERELKYFEMQWQENKIEIDRLTY
jgi:protein-arginine kinase activator protein McsA